MNVIIFSPSGMILPQHNTFHKKEMTNTDSILIKDTTREQREKIVHQALYGDCGSECEFCSGCDSLGGGGIEKLYQPYIDGLKEISEINAEYNARFVR